MVLFKCSQKHSSSSQATHTPHSSTLGTGIDPNKTSTQPQLMGLKFWQHFDVTKSSTLRQIEMSFLKVAAEIRLKIYAELLVVSEPIAFIAAYGSPSPLLFRSQKNDIHPAVLRASRQVYDEAGPVLYSNNCFRFPTVFSSARPVPNHACIAPFLIQIGAQARHIRHIRLPFPEFKYPVPGEATLHEVHIENLELIRKTCTNLKTLELLIPLEHCNYALDDWPIASEALNVLDNRLKHLRSLQKIIINFEEYPECDPSDDLTKKMRDMGWIVMITTLPKKVWISCDDRVEFDNEEDCKAYDNEWFRKEAEMEQQREDEEWLEEYYRRRQDPYWKNDSDYD